MRPILRLMLVIGAVIVAAWFGLGWVQARDMGQAESVTGGARLPAARAAHVASLLKTAETLNPDRTVDILRAQLADQQGDPAQGVRIMQRLTRDEPLNLEAWRELGVAATHNHQPHLAEMAFTQVLHLVGYRR